MSLLLFLLCACGGPRWPRHHGGHSHHHGGHASDTAGGNDCASTDGRLDLAAGCADGACLGGSFESVGTALGEPQSCAEDDYQVVLCAWPSGISLAFADVNENLVPDPKSTVQQVTLALPWDGGTTDGLGLGAPFSCFTDTYGDPTTSTYEGDVLRQVSYGWLTLSDDVDNASGATDADGLVDRILLTGTP